MRVQIEKDGNNRAVFTLDEQGRAVQLETNDPIVRGLWNAGVPGVHGKHIVEADMMLTVSARFKPEDPRFAFNFLEILESVYGCKWRRAAT